MEVGGRLGLDSEPGGRDLSKETGTNKWQLGPDRQGE